MQGSGLVLVRVLVRGSGSGFWVRPGRGPSGPAGRQRLWNRKNGRHRQRPNAVGRVSRAAAGAAAKANRGWRHLWRKRRPESPTRSDHRALQNEQEIRAQTDQNQNARTEQAVVGKIEYASQGRCAGSAAAAGVSSSLCTIVEPPGDEADAPDVGIGRLHGSSRQASRVQFLCRRPQRIEPSPVFRQRLTSVRRQPRVSDGLPRLKGLLNLDEPSLFRAWTDDSTDCPSSTPTEIASLPGSCTRRFNDCNAGINTSRTSRSDSGQAMRDSGLAYAHGFGMKSCS